MRRATGLLVGLFAWAVVLAAPQPARAQPARSSRLILDQITTLLQPGSTLRLAISTSAPPPTGVDLAVAVYPRVGSRSEFTLAADGALPRSPLDLQPYDIGELAKDGSSWVIERSVRGPDTTTDDPLILRQEGVYPLTVSLRGPDGAELDRLVTFVIFFPEPRLPPYFRVALVSGVHSRPARLPDGSLHPDLSDTITREVGPQAELVRAAVERSMPVTAAVRGVTLDEWDELARTGAVAPPSLPTAGAEYLAEPYAGLSPGVLAERRLEGEVGAQIQRGRRALEDRGLTVNGTLAVTAPGGLGPRSARTLAQHGARRFLLEEHTLTPLALDLTLTRPFQVDASGVFVEAVAADPALAAALLRPTDQPRAVAARVLAELTVLYLDAPGEERGAVIALPEDAAPNPLVWQALLEDIDRASYLLPVTLSEYFADVPFARDGADAQRRLVRTFKISEPALPETTTTAMLEARTRVTHLRSMVGESPAARLSHDLLTVALGAADDAVPFFVAIDSLIRQELDRLQAFAGSVTLAAPRGDIPVTLENQNATDVTVTVTFATDRLRFPESRSRTVRVPPRRHTMSIPVEALTTGSVPLDVVVTSPCEARATQGCDSALVVARTRITVTSTKVSAVAVVVAGGALGFLLLWWGRAILTHPRRRGRSGRRLASDTPSAPREDS